jgi:hypothetical protein
MLTVLSVLPPFARVPSASWCLMRRWLCGCGAAFQGGAHAQPRRRGGRQLPQQPGRCAVLRQLCSLSAMMLLMGDQVCTSMRAKGCCSHYFCLYVSAACCRCRPQQVLGQGHPAAAPHHLPCQVGCTAQQPLQAWPMQGTSISEALLVYIVCASAAADLSLHSSYSSLCVCITTLCCHGGALLFAGSCWRLLLMLAAWR